MADVGGTSATGVAARARLGGLAVSAVVALVVSGIAIVSSGGIPAGAANAGSAGSTLQQDAAVLDQTQQQYFQALAQLHAVQVQHFYVLLELQKTQQDVSQDQAALRRAALSTYTQADEGGGLASLFSHNAEQASVTGEYQNVATGNLTAAVGRLDQDQAALNAQNSQLELAQQQAQQALDKATAAQRSANATLLAERSIAAPVSSSEAPPPVAASSPQAAKAIAAAESQIGVPYVWGGESPGSGFDCSGLTQWAWGQAGISLPRTAAEQYSATTHVSLSNAQPGDLVFWDDGTSSIQHVAIYLGNDKVLHAPSTGSRVQITTLWTSGLVGVGRP